MPDANVGPDSSPAQRLDALSLQSQAENVIGDDSSIGVAAALHESIGNTASDFEHTRYLAIAIERLGDAADFESERGKEPLSRLRLAQALATRSGLNFETNPVASAEDLATAIQNVIDVQHFGGETFNEASALLVSLYENQALLLEGDESEAFVATPALVVAIDNAVEASEKFLTSLDARPDKTDDWYSTALMLGAGARELRFDYLGDRVDLERQIELLTRRRDIVDPTSAEYQIRSEMLDVLNALG